MRQITNKVVKRVKIWIADWFAQLKDKTEGDLKKIRAGMNNDKVESLLSSHEINSKVDKYWSLLWDIERREKLAKILSMNGSETDESSAAQIIYQTMHCSNILFLEALLAQLNMQVGKYCDDIERKDKPTILWRHMHPLHQQGQEKMSKSNQFAAMLMEHDEKIKSNNTVNPIRRVRKRLNTKTEACVLALYRDLSNFETTSKVPEQFESWVLSSSKKAQALWYTKILEVWNEEEPRPKTGLEASKIVATALKKHRKANVEGILSFYGLPSPPERVMFEIETLPVDRKSVAVGNTITVYASSKDPIVSFPKEVSDLVVKRAKALAKNRYYEAKALHKMIKYFGYRMISFENEEVLAMKFVIRLSGIDAPKSKMQYGKESHDELLKIVEGKSLKVLIYKKDLYRRWVGDVYCNGEFIQETMLRKGMAWHYVSYDKRTELAKWENEAREKGIGLWASSNPEEPWEWRNKNKRGGYNRKKNRPNKSDDQLVG